MAPFCGVLAFRAVSAEAVLGDNETYFGASLRQGISQYR